MKKIMSLILTLIMLWALALPSSAYKSIVHNINGSSTLAELTDGNGTVEDDEGTEGEENEGEENEGEENEGEETENDNYKGRRTPQEVLEDYQETVNPDVVHSSLQIQLGVSTIAEGTTVTVEREIDLYGRSQLIVNGELIATNLELITTSNDSLGIIVGEKGVINLTCRNEFVAVEIFNKLTSLGLSPKINGNCVRAGVIPPCFEGHTWGSDGKCSQCGILCEHNWSNGKCSVCQKTCENEFHTGTFQCPDCKMSIGAMATGSVLSEGNLTIIVGIAGVALGFLAAMFVFKKKQKPALAGGIETDEE